MAVLPDVGQGKRGEQGYLGYLLRQAAAAYRTRAEQSLADLDVTLPQFSVLTMLAAYPGLSNADLARMALLTPQTVSVIVGNLERANLIRRSPHAVHGRVLQIDLTEQGRNCLASARERIQVLEKEVMAQVPSEDEQAVRRWLVSVATSLGKGASA